MQKKKGFEIEDDSFWSISNLLPKSKEQNSVRNNSSSFKASAPSKGLPNHRASENAYRPSPPTGKDEQTAFSDGISKTANGISKTAIGSAVSGSTVSSRRPFTSSEIHGDVTAKKDQSVIKNSELPSFSDKPEKSYTLPGGILHSVEIYSWPNRYTFFSGFRKSGIALQDMPPENAPFAPFFSFMPQYHQLTASQLRFYLYWRKCFKEGVYIPTDLSYLLLFAYEMINLPDIIPPEEGADLLAKLWIAYRRNYPKIEKYLAEWLCDYCLIHGVLPKEGLFDTIAPYGRQHCSFKEFYISTKDGAADMICSAYNYKTGKYYTPETAELFDRHIPGAMKRLFSYLESEKNPHFRKEPREISKISRTSYDGAVCVYLEKKRIDITYLPYRTLGTVSVVTDGVKLCENYVRAACGIRSRLATPSLTPAMRRMVELYFAEHLPSRAVSKKAEEENYMARYDAENSGFSEQIAEEIERKSLEVANRLGAVYSEEEAEHSDPFSLQAQERIPPRLKPLPKDIADPQSSHTETAGESTEWAFKAGENSPAASALKKEADGEQLIKNALRILVKRGHRAFVEFAGSNRLLPHSLAEKINDAALDRYGDIAITEEDRVFSPLEDYKEEIESWITS